MKLGFNDLIEAYNEFKFIQNTYKGEKNRLVRSSFKTLQSYHSECKGCHYRPKSLPGKTIQESLELLDNWLNK